MQPKYKDMTVTLDSQKLPMGFEKETGESDLASNREGHDAVAEMKERTLVNAFFQFHRRNVDTDHPTIDEKTKALVFTKERINPTTYEQDLQYSSRKYWSNPFRQVIISTKRMQVAKVGSSDLRPNVTMGRALLAAAHHRAPYAHYSVKPLDGTAEDDEMMGLEADEKYENQFTKLSSDDFQSRRHQFREYDLVGNCWKSTKIVTATSKIKEHLAGRSGKAVVFCSSIAVLDIMEIGLKKELGVKCIRYDGNSNSQARKVLEVKFQNEADWSEPVMLIQTRAVGEDSCFTAANYGIFLIPEWNPLVEWRCAVTMDRHGQLRQVTIHRLIAECSMDLRVIEKQRLKLRKMRGLFLCNREHVPKEDLAVYDSMNMFMEKIKNELSVDNYLEAMADTFNIAEE
ncbi:P-loop containing nucleoside triphosphate hydrolase protein [Leptodontidium sp. 2 PMI_412]|nr:P-loop containing nucleoside triphosphate hydrolase protein [Leptodontidium sp. 2 PMI_412]